MRVPALRSVARQFCSLVPDLSRKSSTDMFAFWKEQEISETNLDQE